MSNPFSEHQIKMLSDFVHTRMALHFPENRWADLAGKLRSASVEMGFSDPTAFAQWVLTSSLSLDHFEVLASHLTTSETYFWREPQTFAALMSDVLPGLIRTGEKQEQRLRIWCAGCSTGEEAFSIAIALHKLIPNLASWNITILATDINPRILRQARAGVYGEKSFRHPPIWLKKYFRQKDDQRFEVLPEIRKMVTFGYLNLAEDIYPSPGNNTNAMDIIFCRNVLMYFSRTQFQHVVQGFFACLVAGGWLVVSGNELADEFYPQFTPVAFPGAWFYRKDTAPAHPPAFMAKTSSLRFPGKPARRTHSGVYRVAVLPPILQGSSQRDLIQAIRVLANQGKLKEAMALCETAIAENRLVPALHFMRAIILQEQNQENEGLVCLRRAIYLDPNYVLAHFAMGNLLLHQGNTPGAMKSFETVVELLAGVQAEENLPEFDGLTFGRLGKIVHATLQTLECA